MAYRAVVAVPPVKDFYRTRQRHSALGPRIVMSILEDAGWDALFFNFPLLSEKGRRVPLPEEFGHLSPFILPRERGPASYFSRFQHFGPDFNECADLILDHDPHIVFLSCFAFCYGEETGALAAALRRKKRSVVVAAGGAGVSVHPDYFLDNYGIDLVFTGEIEESLSRFIQEFRPGEKVRHPFPKIFKGPAPDSKSFRPVWAVTEEKNLKRTIAVSVARGCPKSCRFCSVHLSQSQEFRTVPLPKVETMLSLIPGDMKLRCNFEDDNLLCDPSYFLSVVKLFANRYPHTEFTAENGIDYLLLTPALAEELIDLGFIQFNLSLASLNRDILGNQNRGFSLPRYEDLLDVLEKRTVPSVTYFICGLEGDTPESIGGTLLYLSDKPTLLGISLFYPVPGIPGFISKVDFNETPPRLTASTAAYPWNNSLTTQQMVTAFRLTRFINLLKSPTAVSNYRDLIENVFSTRQLHALVKKQGVGLVSVPVPNMDEALMESVLGGLGNPVHTS